MADVRLELGAVVDLATGNDVGSIMGKLGSIERTMGRRDPRPLYKTLANSQQQGIAAGGLVTLSVGGPSSGKLWDIRQLVALGADAFTDAQAGSTIGVAAAGGTLVLPPGAVLTGFTVTSASAAAPVSGVVTVTNVVGGPLSYDYSFVVGGSVLAISFPNPLVAVPTATGQITITVPAVVGGSAYTIVATWVLPFAWYISSSDGPNVGLTEIVVPGDRYLPDTVVPGSSESIFVHFGEHLVCQVAGLGLGASATIVARIAEWPDTVPEGRWS